MASTSGRADVLIVGGGVIGISIAERLAGEGVRVHLIEAEATGAGASGAAAGMLAPLAEAGQVGPLLEFGLQGLAQFESLCARLIEQTGIDPEFERSGLLEVAVGDAELARLEQKRARFPAVLRSLARAASADPVRADAGCPAPDLGLERFDGARLHERLPGLIPAAQGALGSAQEGHLRPPRLVRALEASARQRGATIESGLRAERLLFEADRVVGVETSKGRLEAPQVIVAAGAWSARLLEASALGVGDGAAPWIEPVRGQILELAGPLPALDTIVWAAGAYFVPKRDGCWIVGATEEAVGFDRRVTVKGLGWLLERARCVFPALAEASFRDAWAGLRPVSRDGLPWVGRWPTREGLRIAAGHGRNGVLLSPVTARLIADDLLGRATLEPDHPLSPARSLHA